MNILIVEDDEDFAASLVPLFEMRGDLADFVRYGEAGIRLAEQQYEGGNVPVYDCLVLDLALPYSPEGKVEVKHGVDVIRELRTRFNPMPIVVLSAREEVARIVEALQLGADDYVTKKEYQFEVLYERVKAVVRRSRGISGPRLVSGALVMNLWSKEVRFGDQVFKKLAPQAFELLKLLIEFQARPLSNDAIHNRVFDPRSEKGDFDSQNVRYTTMNNIRNAVVDAVTMEWTLCGAGEHLAVFDLPAEDNLDIRKRMCKEDQFKINLKKTLDSKIVRTLRGQGYFFQGFD